jgi:hypothetical protein
MKIPCKLCRYWHAHAVPRADQPDAYWSDDARGECHRKAPTHTQELTRVAFWPVTDATDWCGEAVRL